MTGDRQINSREQLDNPGLRGKWLFRQHVCMQFVESNNSSHHDTVLEFLKTYVSSKQASTCHSPG